MPHSRARRSARDASVSQRATTSHRGCARSPGALSWQMFPQPTMARRTLSMARLLEVGRSDGAGEGGSRAVLLQLGIEEHVRIHVAERRGDRFADARVALAEA